MPRVQLASNALQTIAANNRMNEGFLRLESDDLVGFAVVRPEPRAIVRECASREWNAGEVRKAAGAVAADFAEEIVAALFIVGRHDKEIAVHVTLTTDSTRQIDLTHYVSLFVEAENPAIVPLAHVEPRSVVTKLRAGFVVTLDRVLRFEAVTRNETANDAIVFVAFAADNAYLVADDRHAPRFTRRLLFLDNGPLARVERVEAIRIDRSHPEFVAVKRKRLGARRRRRQPQRFSYIMHARSLSFWSPATSRHPMMPAAADTKKSRPAGAGLDSS